MEKQGSVSLWIGTTRSRDDLAAFVAGACNEDGDYEAASFERGFRLEHRDEDFREVEYFDVPLTALSAIPGGFSYHDTILPAFAQLADSARLVSFNAAILVYNYAYDGAERSFSDGINSFEYIGSVVYQ